VTRTRTAALAALAISSALVLAACGGGSSSDSSASGDANLSGSVRIDGSSTVYPLTATAAEDFMAANPGVQVTVAASGTGGGFEKFCRGESDANDASRPIKEEEAAACAEAGIEYAELVVATDALTVVVNAENDWATCLTVEELNKIWAPESTVRNWNEVRSDFPDVPLDLFGPGTDSGTFDYFTDEINGEEGASRADYTPSEDDNVIVQGVSGTPGGLGYFGFTYYEENADKLKAVEIDSGAGCVAPSVETAQNGTYTPLARPLSIYPSKAALQQPQVKAFFDYYIANNAAIAEGALFIPLNADQEAELQAAYQSLLGS
jgi:phosphate transport system substrate-binding protein